MVKRLSIATVVATALITSGFMAPTIVAHAASTNGYDKDTTEIVNSSNSETTPTQLKQYDSYVGVKDNQFILKTSANVLSKQIRNNIQKQLNVTNESILKNNLRIDPNDKKIESLTRRASPISGMTIGEFWWGTRDYFYTNKAVSDFVYLLEQGSSSLENMTIISGVFSLPISVISALGSSHLNSEARDLEHYNNEHYYSHIYMDTNAVGGYSFGTF